MAHPGYPNPLSVRSVIERLADAATSTFHEFWPDDISLLDAQVAHGARIHGPRQITDVYLIALAVRRGGQFVTFDRTVVHHAVVGADKHHMLVL